MNEKSGSPSTRSDILAIISKFTEWPLAWRLGAAVVAVILGVAFRYFFLGVLDGHLVYNSLFPAVAVAAVVGGVSGGVLATVLSALAAHALMVPLGAAADLVGLLSFCVSSAVIIGITNLLRMALQRIAANELIRHSERQLSQFVEQSSAAMAMFDTDMRYLAASARWRDDYHLDRDVVGKSHYDVFPEMSDEWKEIHRRALAGQTIRSDRDSFTRLEGPMQWLRWEVRPWVHRQGGIGGVLISVEDTTARVEAEQAEQQIERRLHVALAAAGAGVWEWDLRTNDVFWSDELWALYGLAPHSVRPSYQAWRQTVHANDRAQVAVEVDHAVAEGRELYVEWRVATNADVGERWLMARGRPLSREDGKVSRYGGVVIDITTRKRAEQEALATKAQLEAALSSMADAVFISDAAGRFSHLNKAFATFHKFGARKECYATIDEYRAIFQTFDAEGHETPPDQWPVPRALRGEAATGVELGVRRKDTGEHWLGSYSFAPIRDKDGAIVGSVVTARDITEKRQIVEALRDSERRFKAVFDTSMDAIAIIDRHGTILSVNPELQANFGYAPQDMIGENVKMLMPPDRAVEHDGYLANYLAGGEPKVIGKRRRVEGQRKDGASFPLELAVARAEAGDQLFIGFMRDLTEIENETRKSEAAREELLHVARLSDMGEVAAGLAHEVSQPLTAILSYASVGRRALSPTTEPSIANAITVIESQAKNAADILRRLRGFIEKRESQRYPESLAKLVEDALALASVRSSGRRVRIVVKLSAEDIDVNVDRVQILQVLINFLRNAADVMTEQDDSEIVIETTMAKPGVARVNVSDNGPGIDPKVADRLFTPFVTTKTFGMGVGLSLCKTIIQSHGGEIGCAANAPKGATFWFTLPVVERDGTGDGMAAATTGADNGVRAAS